MRNKFHLQAGVAALLASALLGAAHAESNFVSTSGPATARLDFKITIPKVLYLRVGTGTNMANNTAIDLIDFTVPAANVGDGTAIAGTGGDLGGGAVTAAVKANNGSVTLTSTTLGALTNATADTISYAQISTAVTGAAPLPHPTLTDAPAGTTITVPATGKIVNKSGTWTFSYLNQNLVAPGTYGGVNTQNGRVTYTASMP